MASCNWEKLKTPQQVKAMLRHCAKDTREKSEHSNREIDKTRTHLNTSFGAMKDYKTAATFYDKRIAELDAMPGANKRKDRVTAIGLNIPFPVSEKEVKEGHGLSLVSLLKDQWYKQVYEAIEERFGTENVIGGVVHYDEVHEYTDAETGERRQSRHHLHVYVVPVINEKLNAKNVMSRRNMIELNNAVEEISKGYCTSFMTGTKRKSTKSVEELKNESQMAEVQQEAQRIKAEAQKRSDEILNAARVDAERIHKEAVEDAQRRSDAILNAAKVQAGEIRKKAAEDAQRRSDAMLEDVRTTKRSAKNVLCAARDLYNDCRDLLYDVRKDAALEDYCCTLRINGKTVLDAYREKCDEKERKRTAYNERFTTLWNLADADLLRSEEEEEENSF